RVPPGAGTGQLERVLDALARARFREDAPAPAPPAPRAECVWVTPGRDHGGGWGDVYALGAA
ncbi:MAG: hypothetical protein AVDCRST_MAG68-654, partial [uncultured Gemmatimonadetes bacterium]